METTAGACHFGDCFHLMLTASCWMPFIQPLSDDSSSVLIPNLASKLTRWVEDFSHLRSRSLGGPLDMVPTSAPYYSIT